MKSKSEIALFIIVFFVVAGVLGTLIYYSLEVSSKEPVDSTVEERQEWFEILESQDFVIDKGTKNVQLGEFLYFKMESLEFGSWNRELGLMSCEFVSKEGDYIFEGVIYNGEEALVCEVSGCMMALWFEGGSYPHVVVQGEEERLIFTPRNHDRFQS